MNLTYLATDVSRAATEHKALFGYSPNVLIVPPFLHVELLENPAFAGLIDGLRVIESIHVSQPTVAHVDPNSMGKLARFDA